MLASEKRKDAIKRVPRNRLEKLLGDWSIWARAEQRPPDGDWRVWLLMGGRGAGKTRAGAEWVRGLVHAGAASRVALVGSTIADVREVMVGGPSGLANLDRYSAHAPPRYEASRRRLVWDNGAVAYAFSAEDPDSLRGPQFDAAWCDEFAAWSYTEDTWANLRLGLRLGDDPRAVVTTTPRPTPAMKALIAEAGVVTTRAPTQGNRANLAPGFLEAMEAAYGGTSRARQELMGELIEDPEGALWTRAMIEAALRRDGPEIERVVVAVDPPVSEGARADACGIVVAGAGGKGRDARAVVLADRTVQGLAPDAWARRVVETAAAFDADYVVAEVNQGGSLVRTLLEIAEPGLAVKEVRATRGKAVRAEPVALLYERGRVAHAQRLRELEDEMCAFGAPGFKGSPDRVDALVWAVTDLLLGKRGDPSIRVLT